MNKDKYILCIDASLSCTGYAVFDYDENLIETGHIDTHLIKCKNKEIHSEKLLFIFNSLNVLSKKYDFNLVLQERSFVQHNTTTKILHKVVGVIELLFNKLDIILISPQSTKCLLCRKDATKEDMIKAVNFNLGSDLTDDNESDAAALGIYYFSKKRDGVEISNIGKKKTVKRKKTK